MSPRQFDRYMIAIGAGRHVKFRRLTIAERYAFFMGVLSIAAQAPIRGRLLVGPVNAEDADIASEANVPLRVAHSTMAKLRSVGVIYRDDENGCEAVHDFEDWNPEPKKDGTNAERQRRYRERRNGVSNAVTNGPEALRNAGEVEVEVEVTPLTPQGGNGRTLVSVPDQQSLVAPPRPKTKRERDINEWQHQFDAWVAEHFPGCAPSGLRMLVGCMAPGEAPTPDAVRRHAESNPNFLHLLEPAA